MSVGIVNLSVKSVSRTIIGRNGGAVNWFETQFFGFIEIFEQIELVYYFFEFN